MPQKLKRSRPSASSFTITDGYVYGAKDPKSNLADLRFRVFSQSSTGTKPSGGALYSELLVLWHMAHDRLHIDHKKMYEEQVVDVYLCEGGDPGSNT